MHDSLDEELQVLGSAIGSVHHLLVGGRRVGGVRGHDYFVRDEGYPCVEEKMMFLVCTYQDVSLEPSRPSFPANEKKAGTAGFEATKMLHHILYSNQYSRVMSQ